MADFKLAQSKNIVKMFRRDNTILIYIIMVAIAMGIVFASFFAFYQNHQKLLDFLFLINLRFLFVLLHFDKILILVIKTDIFEIQY